MSYEREKAGILIFDAAAHPDRNMEISSMMCWDKELPSRKLGECARVDKMNGQETGGGKR